MNAYKLMLVKDESIHYPDDQVATAETVAKVAAGYIGSLDRETLIVLALNTQLHIVGINTVSIGTLDMAYCHPREVYKFAILSNASSIIIAHNHPSGETKPSQADIELTDRLIKAGELLGITVLDHIIIGLEGRYLSMKKEGLI
jgi:DNA repair protein RadC